MALADGDWSVAVNGDIRSVAGSTNHLVLELHRWLMDKLDNATSGGDDLLDVTNGIIPSRRVTDDIIILNSPYNITDTEAQRFYGGSIQYNDGDDLYSGLAIIASFSSGQPQVIQNNVKLTNFWGSSYNPDATTGAVVRILVKTRTAGADIDGKRVRAQMRATGQQFAEFSTTLGTGEGVAALGNLQPDSFNQTADATVATWGTITNVEGYQLIDLNNGNGPQPYYSQWNKGIQSRNDLYERVKWIQRDGSATTIYGLNGELYRGITHQFNYDGEVGGPWTEPETLTFGNGATAQLLAVDDNGVDGTMWIQLLTGLPPANDDTITGGTSGATGAVNGSLTARPLPAASALGAFTGQIQGAFGVGVEAADIISTDTLTDLLNATQNPPNNVAVSLTALASGDVVFSAYTKEHSTTVNGAHSLGDTAVTLTAGIPTDFDQPGRIVINSIEYAYASYAGAVVTLAGAGLAEALTGGETAVVTQFDNDEFTLAAGNNLGNGTLVVNEVIGVEFPSAGEVRVWNGTNYDRYAYTSYATSTFTLSGTLSQNYTLNDPAFVPIIDEVSGGTSISKTVVYPGSDRQGRHRVYNAAANIVPFEVGFTVGSGGSTTQAIRGSDA